MANWLNVVQMLLGMAAIFEYNKTNVRDITKKSSAISNIFL